MQRLQRHVLHLAESNSSPQAAWRKIIEVLETGYLWPPPAALFPEERAPEVDGENIVRIRLHEMERRRPRLWRACRLMCCIRIWNGWRSREHLHTATILIN